MQYRFTKRDFKTYLKYVRRPAKQCAGGGCVLAQFIERIGGKKPQVTSWDAEAAFGNKKRRSWVLPCWARASINAFDVMDGVRGWVKAKDYKRVLSAI